MRCIVYMTTTGSGGVPMIYTDGVVRLGIGPDQIVASPGDTRTLAQYREDWGDDRIAPDWPADTPATQYMAPDDSIESTVVLVVDTDDLPYVNKCND